MTDFHVSETEKGAQFIANSPVALQAVRSYTGSQHRTGFVIPSKAEATDMLFHLITVGYRVSLDGQTVHPPDTNCH